MSLPDVWRNAGRDNLVVVYEDCTISYELAVKDTGEDRVPEMVNTRYIGYGAEGLGYYSGWDIIEQKDEEDDNRVPVVFRRGEHVEVVYSKRTEVYREKEVYPVGSNGRIYEEFGQEEYENYYRNNGFRQVAP